MSRFAIIDRLDLALQKARFRQEEVRAIYLTTEDRDAFDRAMRAKWRRKIVCFDYEGHEIRRGERSRIYLKHGAEIALARLSPRVRQAA